MCVTLASYQFHNRHNDRLFIDAQCVPTPSVVLCRTIHCSVAADLQSPVIVRAATQCTGGPHKRRGHCVRGLQHFTVLTEPDSVAPSCLHTSLLVQRHAS